MAKPFKFKRFTVGQDKCAMKIGADGVLLGAWASVEDNPSTVLDIDSGTGVLALMIAQKSLAETIDAIEIDEAAFEQCVQNSDWADRFFCYHASFDEFLDYLFDGKEGIEDHYDQNCSNCKRYNITSAF